MSTNYYRILRNEEFEERKIILLENIRLLEPTPENFNLDFSLSPKQDSKYDWDRWSPWDKFMDGMKIHLGKRSAGWKFCWNFHNDKYYKNKDELLSFILSGNVLNEYGYLVSNDEFIDMALNWGQPDGLDMEKYYEINERPSWLDKSLDGKIIDGLWVSGSSDFC